MTASRSMPLLPTSMPYHSSTEGESLEADNLFVVDVWSRMIVGVYVGFEGHRG